MLIEHENRRNLILRYGVSSPTRFEMRMNLPLGSQNNEFFNSQIDERIGSSAIRLSLSCEQTDIPGRLFSTADHKIYTIDRKMPYGTMMEDITMTFRCSLDMFERKFFEAWQSLIHNPITKDYGYYDDYTVDIEIFEYEPSLQNVVHGIKIIEAYPFSVFPYNLQDDGENQVIKQSIGFKYKEWKPIEVNNNISRIVDERVNSFPNFTSLIRNLTPRNIFT